MLLSQNMRWELNFVQSLLSLLKIYSFGVHILTFSRICLSEDTHVKDKENLLREQKTILD